MKRHPRFTSSSTRQSKNYGDILAPPEQPPTLNLGEPFRRREPRLTVAAPIEEVAVWDTVGSLGFPNIIAVRIDAFQFADKSLVRMFKVASKQS